MRILTFLSLALFATACADGPNRFEDFDREVRAFLTEKNIESATAVVVHRDRGIVHVRGFGEFDKNRISLLASSSKVLSVGVIMRLADLGVLDIDEPISTYLAAEYGEFKTDITLAQMLSNSSGMVGLTSDALYSNYLCQYVSIGTLEVCGGGIYTADDLADRAPPDTEFRYGGGQWQLAGMVAEHVSGKSWAELVEETYAPCNPSVLGYNNHYTRAFLDAGSSVEAALSYPAFFDGDLSVLKPVQNVNIEGGAYADVRSYGEILLMHLRGGVCDDGRVLSEAAVRRMQEDRIGPAYGGSSLDPSMPGYGLGWFVSRSEPGVVADPGAFGAYPYIDNEHGYAVMIIVEETPGATAGIRERVSPILERVFAEW